MKKYLEKQLELRDIPGLAVGVTHGEKNGAVIVGKGINLYSTFDCGSIIKTAIATEIFMKAERGEIEMTDEIIRMLSHTSAMRDDGGPLWKPEESIFCYCNKAYDILYEKYLNNRVTILNVQEYPLADAYEKDENNRNTRVYPKETEFKVNLMTLMDYAKAHLARKYLSEEGYEEMWKERALVPNTGEHIACGWFIWDYNGKRYYGHEGGVTGYRTAMFLCPEDDSSYIVLANSSEAPVRKIVEGIIDVDSV